MICSGAWMVVFVDGRVGAAFWRGWRSMLGASATSITINLFACRPFVVHSTSCMVALLVLYVIHIHLQT